MRFYWRMFQPYVTRIKLTDPHLCNIVHVMFGEDELIKVPMRSRWLRSCPKWGMCADGVLYRLKTPELCTDAIDGSASLIFPTPVATDSINRQMSQTPVIEGRTIRHQTDKGYTSQLRLNQVVKYPTPTVNGNSNRKGASATSGDGLATVVKKWSTPQARDYKGPVGANRQTPDLPDEVGAAAQNYLNPDWVTHLMGFPDGWLNIGESPGPIKNNSRGSIRAPYRKKSRRIVTKSRR